MPNKDAKGRGMAKTKKKKTAAAAPPRKKLTSERSLKNRPVDEPEPPEHVNEEAGDEAADEEESLVTVETPRTRKGKGRQPRLPGTEDAEIEELERIAEEYVDIRDKRQRLTVNEVRLKGELLAEMKKNSKDHYNHGGCEITVVVEQEKVRVKFHKDEE
jgi:hypothetical protein